MPLETQALSMAALSVVNNVPPNGIQPRLANGIHLRWAFERDRGFPWFGYYLYRRASTGGDRGPRNIDMRALPLGSAGSTTLAGPDGTLSSNVPLVGTDDFTPAGTSEADLAGRTYLRYTPADVAKEVQLKIGFRADAEVVVTGFLQQIPVATIRVKGAARSIELATLKFDAITSVDIDAGPAALVEIGFRGATDNPLADWQPVPGFPGKPSAVPYPLCLPVAHPDYTCPGAPANSVTAEALANTRVKYALPPMWGSNTFGDLHATLRALVDGGPSGPSMAGKQHAVNPTPPDPGLTMKRQAPLDLVLLGALHPGIAQMIGLAWVDESAASTPDLAYDYLLVADHKGLLGGEWKLGLDYLRARGFGDVDAYIVSDKKVNDPSPALEPPPEVRAYALPGGTSTMTAGAPADANAAGLRWDRGVTSLGVLLPDKPVLYHVWRAGLGSGATPTAPGAYGHRTTEGPIVVADPEASSALTQPPQDWPPVRLYFVDGGLADGWYGYQVSGVDLFGRHSANSAAAAWYQWTPEPAPLPWYYKPPPSNSVVHPSAVGLLDKIGPPPPPGVEAWVLDAADPLLVEDTAYAAWRAGLRANEQSLVGLRVSWLWPQSHMDQAPDTREFRIYVHRGRRNTLLGDTTTVAATSVTESTVDTNIPNTRGANAYVETRLQIGDSSFRVVASEATAPLRLRVANNTGPDGRVRPASNAPCSVAIPETIGTDTAHPLHVDFSVATSWDERYYVVPVGNFASEDFVISVDRADHPLTGAIATAGGSNITLTGPPDLAGAGIVGSYLRLSGDTARADKLYRILRVDAAAGGLVVDGAPALASGSSAWTISRKLRRYERFLPAPGDADRGGSPLRATSARPLAYGSVGVSAADDKTHTLDAAKWAAGRWGGASRFGNEGRVGAPATIYQVYRGKPEAPQLPTFTDDRLFASRADYHNRSFFTFRWLKPSGAKTHVLRALDDTLFQTDWLIRSTRTALSAAEKAHESSFPPGWTPTDRQAAVAELNVIASEAAYARLSQTTRLVLARLPGNEGLMWGEGLAERDWEIRRTRTELGPGDQALFPADWNAADAANLQKNLQKRQDTATALNRITSLKAYAALSNNALRVLASLPGNEAAFAQLTILPLGPSDPAAADVRGPDSPDAYAPIATLCAYVDPLDGRSSNRYFYRALNVNAVQTRGDLSLSTPPVCCPDVMPPRAPVFTKARGADRAITLCWASNREPDLAAYRVYRTDRRDDARDVRLMQLAHTDAVAPGDPATRPREVVASDTDVAAGRAYWYRLTAIDSASNESEASPPVCAQAYELTLPLPLPIESASWQELAGVLRLVVDWTPRPGASVRLLRRPVNSQRWGASSRWVDGTTGTVSDEGAVPHLAYDLYLQVRSASGNMSNPGPTTRLPSPYR